MSRQKTHSGYKLRTNSIFGTEAHDKSALEKFKKALRKIEEER